MAGGNKPSFSANKPSFSANKSSLRLSGLKQSAIVDTNIFVSAIIRGGTCYKLLKAWQEDKFTLVTSKSLFDELADVLGRKEIYQKYHIEKRQIKKILDGLELNATFTIPLSILELPVHSRDPKDDMLLACSLGAKVDYLITGDDDLLVLNGHKRLKGLKIVPVKDFLSFL